MAPRKPTSLPRRHFMTSMVRSEESMTMKNNQEEILDALTDFERRPSKEIPPVLEQFLRDVAQTGETLFPWSRVKVLFKWKLEQVMADFNEDSPTDHLPAFPNVENIKFEEYRQRILAAVERFHGVPFTIQRLCELITEPKKHYKKSDKFLRGIEKNVLVVSTVDPMGRREMSECKMLVNGMDTNGCSPKADRSGEEDSGIPEVQAMVPIQPESSHNVSTKWPMSIPAISVPGPTLVTATSALSPSTTTTPCQEASPALAAALTEEREEKAESASNGLRPQEEEMEEKEIGSGETDSQSSSSDDSLPFAPAEASQASEQSSSNSEAEESQPAGSKGHSDQDSSITTSDGAAEVSMQWPAHSMTVNNSAEASACPLTSSPPQALGPPSEVTISTSNSASPTSDPDLHPSDKSNNAESEAEARSASSLGEDEEERENSSQGECSEESGPVEQQQCEVDSSEPAESEKNGHKTPHSSAEEPACQESSSDLTKSAGAEVSVSSSELAEQADHSAQALSPAEGTKAEAPVEMAQEKEEQQEVDRQQEPTQSEEEPMEQD